MDKKGQPDTSIRDAVKSVSKEITEKYVHEIVKKATERVLEKQSEKLNEKEIVRLEKQLKKLSDEEKLEHFKEAVEATSKNFSQGEIMDEGLLEKIDGRLAETLEKKIPELLPKIILSPMAKAILIAIAIIAVSIIVIVNEEDQSEEFYPPEATIDGVRDEDGEWSEPDETYIEVLPVEPENQAPEAYIDYIEPDTTVYTGTPLTLAGYGTDPDENDQIAAYEWRIGNEIVSNRETFTIETLSVGSHRVEFRVRDENGEWSEPTESRIEVISLPLPDLRVSEFSLDPSTPVQHDPVSVRIIVYNQGTARSDSFIVEWWAGENYREPACIWGVKGLAAGEERILTCTYEGYPSWYKQLTTMVVVDSSEEVAESNEENNINRATISVNPASPAVEYVMYNVFREEKLIVEGGLCEDGTKNCMEDNWGDAGGGYYAMVDKKVALNGQPDKLVELILEQGIDDTKVLAVEEAWDVGGGWALTVTEIDVQKRTVWISLSYNGKPIDDEPALPEGAVYTYVENSIAGETDVPMFVAFVDRVFVGQTSDMVQLRYTWVISRDATVN